MFKIWTVFDISSCCCLSNNIVFYLQNKGIIVGLDNLDAVIDIIRKASSNATASASLRKGCASHCAKFLPL